MDTELRHRLKNALKCMGLESNCSLSDINKAYRELSVTHHPDKGGDGVKMTEVNNAVSLLREFHSKLHQAVEEEIIDICSSPSSNDSSFEDSSSSDDSSSGSCDESQTQSELKCTFCHHVAKDKVLLKKHIKNHTDRGKYKCNMCRWSFSRYQNLKRHKLSHTYSKPLKCDQCHKTFRLKQELSRHTLTHTKEKPFQCTQCQKKISLKSNMLRHSKIHDS